MMHPIKTSTFSLFIVISLVAALPTLHGQENHNSLPNRRSLCPSLTRLPIYWNDNQDVSNKESLGVEIRLRENLSTEASVACTYKILEGWNGTPAQVRMPMPGLGATETHIYEAFVTLSSKLGKVLAKTNVGGIPAVIVDASTVPGKPIWKTDFWLKYFGEDREAPSPDAYDRCVTLINKVFDDALNTFVWYAEEKGLLGDTTTVNLFGESILWSDNLEERALAHWNPATAALWDRNRKVSPIIKTAMRDMISKQDLRAEEGIYRTVWPAIPGRPIPTRKERTHVRGWCEYFRTSAVPLHFSYE